MLETEVAAWFRKERRVTTALAIRLERHMDERDGSNSEPWFDELRRHFSRLRAHVKSQMAAEEADGYLAPVLEARPTLSGQVEEIRQQHDVIAQKLDSVFDVLCSSSFEDSERLGHACQAISRLLAMIKDHQHSEEMLVMQTFNQDIGGHE